MKKATAYTFAQLYDSSRFDCATRVWKKATLASELRNYFSRNSLETYAHTSSIIEQSSLQHMMEIVPDEIQIGFDDTYPYGLPYVSWENNGRLHLSTNFEL